MSSVKGFESFNAATVSLEGSNLIEASAGTGKTYSIAILVLRLVLEKRLSVKEILMVTFTKAAVAELEDRIRLFVRLAFKASGGGTIKDKTISSLVNRAAEQYGMEEVQSLLKEAVLFLDETSVLTIHSFCQITLSEFAFETRQLFGAETLQDTSALLAEEVNKFWRKHVTTVPAELLEPLIGAGLSRDSILQVLKEHLDGKKYFGYAETSDYSFCEEDHQRFIRELQELKASEVELRTCLTRYVVDNAENLKRVSEENSNARKHILHLIDDPESFVQAVVEKRKSAYITKLYQDVLDRCDECDAVAGQRDGILKNVISRLYCLAISKVSSGVTEHKRRNNQMSFDDMIVNLHDSLVKRDNPRLAEELRKKYKAVFVDEFQDTDRLQYEIFGAAFGEGTILFYIGDPKQSIYAWRKADIFTYFKAGEAVDHRYGMNVNYRSSAPYIGAMNLFFKPEPDFDTFYFNEAENAIDYIEIESPEENFRGQLWRHQSPDAPISVCQTPNKDAVYDAVAAQVIALLDGNEYLIGETGKERGISPADIGILVRSNRDGKIVKAKLAKYGIPAVTIGDDKVLQSDEARSLLYLLEAMSDISMQNINRALLSSFTGYKTEDILTLDDEKALELFRKYKTSWDENGIYTALMDFVADYSVTEVLLAGHTENGERIITNLFQLIELLHKVQTRKKLSPLELISWLKRGIEGMETDGDEYELRVESDEDTVKIVTIHKSKGLEYNIVLAPFLDFTIDNKRPFCSFRDAETGEYVSMSREAMSEEQIKVLYNQLEQENRRLLYVAVTRAVYKCFIFKNASARQSTLSVFYNALVRNTSPLIEFSAPLAVPAKYFFNTGAKLPPLIPKTKVRFSLAGANWRRMSYSMLRAEHAPASLGRADSRTEPYERFVFNELTRGAKTGNLLHFIFENVQFGNSNNWPFVIDEAVKRFIPGDSGPYADMLKLLLDHVLHVRIELGGFNFCLADVAHGNQLHEFEFDFRVPMFETAMLETLSDEGMEIHVDSLNKLEGLMNGKMDLFFEWNGKFFILDWKSNYLGSSMSDYSAEGVAAAMNDNNYHLQYLIYTLAAKKYLGSRLPGFDYDTHFGGVLYFFVRGIRKDKDNGIFLYRPPLEKIEKLDKILSGQVAAADF
ncbi:DNA helicase/exodeoxyribonuclease V beta subunit [Arcticibacter tournemirensis]|uniref:RecBCD enzyme subunit RecB n=1 Tax=Arcticibacter tournemirensis TaxID=699437 RepID=A0A5M9HFT1_9SPHI|nr:UvrD-helicase domain-containing protein [Arcticibacter tournemirensis]KAA8485349.1 AAA family ATPase [Arcticibacter tournemirensis]TQM50364.1 DNA helicase/exodeoxyribonuclease V beta subunit [Arcticibacter tournemirensis]